ncbi:hypothetical protein [Rhizobium rhizogenes]|uniref:hypothetical protein n=1 Tax=Rhizobium rhizogenes TaxID=359 RepID=UPI0015728A77|nr:hypothetical protein [Rhizobium rhizogenes]NTF80869.1 hypothetical protein [Rhizobium rhizogenes]
MRAFISGSAARAAILQDEQITYFDYDTLGEKKNAPASYLSRLFANASDVVELEVSSLDSAAEQLVFHWRRDRAVRLFEALLESESSSEALKTAELVEELFRTTPVYAYVASLCFFVPNKDILSFQCFLPRELTRTSTLIRLLMARQDEIAIARSVFDRIQFPSVALKSRIEVLAVEIGLIAPVVFADIPLMRQIIARKCPDRATSQAFSWWADQVVSKIAPRSRVARAESVRPQEYHDSIPQPAHHQKMHLHS